MPSDTQTTVNTNVEGSEQAAESKSPQVQLKEHLSLYPLYVSVKETIYSLPHAKKLSETVAPKYQLVRDAKYIKEVLDKSDLATDAMLNEIDRYVPTLKTLDTAQLTSPVTRPINGILDGSKIAWNNVNESFHKSITEPLVKLLDNLKKQIGYAICDKDGKAILISFTDPLVAPLNSNLEGLVNKYLPETKPVSEKHSCELSRTARILHNATFRVKSPVEQQVTSEQEQDAEQDQ